MKRSCPRGSFSVSDFKIFTQRQSVAEIKETLICTAEEADQNAVEQGTDECAGSDSFEVTESEEEKGHQYGNCTAAYVIDDLDLVNAEAAGSADFTDAQLIGGRRDI